MKTTILLFHPYMNESRVNKALAQAASDAGIEVRDMYKLYPDFKIDLAAEKKVLENTERLVLQFPMFWYSSPALLKQWEDDVLIQKWVYTRKGGLLAGKDLLIAVSPGAVKKEYRRDDEVRYTAPELLYPLHATTDLVQARYAEPFITYGASTMTDEELTKRQQEYVAYLQTPGHLPEASQYGNEEK